MTPTGRTELPTRWELNTDASVPIMKMNQEQSCQQQKNLILLMINIPNVIYRILIFEKVKSYFVNHSPGLDIRRS